MPYGLGDTFDLGRAYAQAAQVQGAQQDQELRGLQIDAIRNPKPKEVTYEEAIGHARLAKGAAASVISDPSDANVRAQYDNLKRTNSLMPGFELQTILDLPPEQRKAGAQQWVTSLDQFLANATTPAKGAKPETGIGNVDPAKFTAASLQEYGKTVDPNTGLGDYSKLVPVPDTGGDQQRSPYSTPVYTADGVYAFNNRTGTMQLAPGGPGILKTTDDPAIRGAVTGAEEAAKLDAQRSQQIEVKIQNMGTMDSMLDEASPLVAVATGSGIGAVVDHVAGWMGWSPSGADAIASLGVMAARLLEMVPRMEGPQSDADRATYEAAVGNLAKAGVPRDQKMAAIRTIRTLNTKYKLEFGANTPAAGAAPAAAPAPTATGPKGEKLILSPDGKSWVPASG